MAIGCAAYLNEKDKKAYFPLFCFEICGLSVGDNLDLFLLQRKSDASLFPKGDNADQLSEVIHIDKPTFITPESDSKILFVLTLDKSRKLSQQISCEAGNTYLAIKVNFRSKDELLIVNKRIFIIFLQA